MTKGQRIALQAEWWPAACRAQGWQANDRRLRLIVCSWCVSLENPSQLDLLNAIGSAASPARVLTSTNDLDNKQDIDRVKACLLMLADDVAKTQEVGQPKIGSARRKRDVIRASLKCLSVVSRDGQSPKKFLASLIEDMFRQAAGGVQGTVTIRDLTDRPNIRRQGAGAVVEGPSDLERLMMRLAQVVNDRRKAQVPALTIHEMKVKAGVRCDCAKCRRERAVAHLPAPAVAEEDWSDLEVELESAAVECGSEEGDPF